MVEGIKQKLACKTKEPCAERKQVSPDPTRAAPPRAVCGTRGAEASGISGAGSGALAVAGCWAGHPHRRMCACFRDLAV